MSAVSSEPFYADVGGGRRFCILHRPAAHDVVRGAVVHIHAFAEEMNKSRRVVATGARALAASGWAVLLIDLAGCGDSSGDFGEATWRGWVDDALFARQFVTERFEGPCWLWGLRAGCLIAAGVNARLDHSAPLLLWQPVLSGRQHLTQFLRLKLANEALSGQADERTGTQALRARLAQGRELDIAGYRLNSALATGLEAAELALDTQRARVVLYEVSTALEPSLTPAAVAQVARLASKGIAVDAGSVTGPPFWQTVEIAECPALVEATLAVMDKTHADSL